MQDQECEKEHLEVFQAFCCLSKVQYVFLRLQLRSVNIQGLPLALLYKQSPTGADILST